jgi:hypothetical protein
MPFVPVPDAVLVDIVYEMDNQVVENTMWFTNSSPIDESAIHALLLAVRNIIEADLMPLLSSTISLVKLIGTLMEVADGLSLVFNTALPISGEASSEQLPSDVSYVITFNTAGRGRASRGRNYMMGIPQDSVLVNTVSSDFRTGLLDFFTTLKAATSEIGWTHVVAHRFSGHTIVDGRKVPTPLTVGVTKPVTSYSTFDATVDSQRRRLPGRGR